MMNISSFGLTVLLGSGLTLNAIERPATIDQNVPRAEPVEPQKKTTDIREQDTPTQVEERAWLGIGGTPLDENLAWHLEIEGGIQLSEVRPDSPASGIGMKRGDIVTAINGTQIYSQNDLRDQIFKHQVGDEVMMSWYHKGRLIEKKVTLGKREETVQIHPQESPWDQARRGIQPRRIPPLQLQDMALSLDEDILRLMEKFNGNGAGFGRGLNLQHQDMQLHLGDLLKEMQQGGNLNLGLHSSSRGSMTFQDSLGKIEVHEEGGKKQLKIHDAQGNLLFEGPYNSEEEKNNVPEELRERIQSLGIDGSGPKFQFQFNDSSDDWQKPETAPRPKPAPGSEKE